MLKYFLYYFCSRCLCFCLLKRISSNNSALEAVTTAAVAVIGGSLVVANNLVLAHVSLTALESIGGAQGSPSLQVSNNLALEIVDWPELDFIDGVCDIEGNPGWAESDFLEDICPTASPTASPTAMVIVCPGGDQVITNGFVGDPDCTLVDGQITVSRDYAGTFNLAEVYPQLTTINAAVGTQHNDMT
jgi:hypothetical protein